MNSALARLRDDIERFEPFNEQERVDKQAILRYMEGHPDCLERSSIAHLACSIWTLDAALERTLLVYHNIYDSWSWIGGHADGEADLASVALRELSEETGVERAVLVPCGIYSLEVLTVDGHVKRGGYVGSHLHLNITYLALADAGEDVRSKPDENSGVRWAPLADAVALSSEPWIASRVYRKLTDKLPAVDASAVERAREKLADVCAGQQG